MLCCCNFVKQIIWCICAVELISFCYTFEFIISVVTVLKTNAHHYGRQLILAFLSLNTVYNCLIYPILFISSDLFA
jgi:hypothetical protein